MESSEQAPPGWYHQRGGLEYFDGNEWTGDRFPDPKLLQDRSAGGSSFASRMVATWAGVVLAWATVWVGAQADPDNIYWPVKFVVEEDAGQQLDEFLTP